MYDKQTWVNGPGGNTPVEAGRLNHIEDGLSDLDSDIAEIKARATADARPLDLRPVTPHAADDDFAGSVLNAKWTKGFKGVNTLVDSGFLTMTPVTPASTKAASIAQVAPAGSFEITAKFSSTSGPGNGFDSSDMRPGIYIANTVTPVALVCGLGMSQGPKQAMAIEVSNYSETADWGAFNNNWSDNKGGVYSLGSFLWYRMKYDGTQVVAYYSANGVRWRQIYSRPQQAPPNRMGIVLYANSTSMVDGDELTVDWFRCKTL